MNRSTLFVGSDDGNARSTNNISPSAPPTTIPGLVLEVCLDSTSSLYEGQSDIGKILYRPLGLGTERAAFFEDKVGTVAYPLDRSLLKYPLPGEQVVIFFAAGDRLELSADDQNRPLTIAYYSSVIASNKSVTSNTNSAFGVPPHRISSTERVTEAEASARFDRKIVDLDAFKDDNNQSKIFKQLQPFEGDFILQGRFGNTLRLGSTNPIEQSPWSKGGGASGDPIVILRVDRAVTVGEQDMLTVEDPDLDDASIYMSSSQTIATTLSCTTKMKAWRQTLGLPPINQEAANKVAGTTNFVQNGI